MTLTVPKAALAGVMPNTSFAIFMVSIATFNKERVASERFGRCDVVAMVEIRGGGENRRDAQAVGDLGPIIWTSGHFAGHATWERSQLNCSIGQATLRGPPENDASGRSCHRESSTIGWAFCLDKLRVNGTILEVAGGWLASLLQVLDPVYESVRLLPRMPSDGVDDACVNGLSGGRRSKHSSHHEVQAWVGY